MLGNNVNQNSHIQFRNFTWMHLGFNFDEFATAYNDRAARGGPAIRVSPNRSVWSGIQSDSRRAVTASVWSGGRKGDEGHSWSAWTNPSVDVRVASRFSTSVGARYSRNADDTQFYATYGAVSSDTTHYTFAHLDQTTISLNARLNFTATPNLSFQFYGEPFTSNGTYADQKEIRNARAERFADRFTSFGRQPGTFEGFNYRQFNSNAVIRYEYRPGNTLFAVWQQGRSNYLTPADPGYNGSYNLSRDYDSSLRDHPNNTFLIKATYWLNP